MTTIYMARRKVYPNETALMGPFTNHQAALACAQDSLYPEAAEVEALEVASIATRYEPQSSYPDWARKEVTTYYGFSNSFDPIPPHLKKDLLSEIAILESFALECFIQRRAEVTESMIIAGLVTRMDGPYEHMHVIWAEDERVIAVMNLTGCFDRLVRAGGYPDRRVLLELLEESITIRDDPYEYEDMEEGLPTKITNEFWNRFVIDHSRPPPFDPDKWVF